METRHRVVEVSHVGETGLVGFADLLEFRFGMRDCRQYAFLLHIAGKIQRAGKLGTDIPPADAMRLFHEGFIFGFIYFFYGIGILRAGHLRIQVRSFEVQAAHGRVLLGHQLLTNARCLADLIDGRSGKRRENRRRPVLQMRRNGCAESGFVGFCEIVSAAAVYVHRHESGNDPHAFGVDHFRADHGQVAIGHFQDLSVAYQYRTVFQPTLRRQDISIDYLC